MLQGECVYMAISFKFNIVDNSLKRATNKSHVISISVCAQKLNACFMPNKSLLQVDKTASSREAVIYKNS